METDTCVLCGSAEDLLWRKKAGVPTDEMVCEDCAGRLIDAGEWDDPADSTDAVA
jgi:hypothetical protein